MAKTVAANEHDRLRFPPTPEDMWRERRPVDIEGRKLRRLLTAVLIRAIQDYRGADGGQHKKRAWIWIRSNRVAGGERGFTFLEICHALDLDPDYVRAHAERPGVTDEQRRKAAIHLLRQGLNKTEVARRLCVSRETLRRLRLPKRGEIP